MDLTKHLVMGPDKKILVRVSEGIDQQDLEIK